MSNESVLYLLHLSYLRRLRAGEFWDGRGWNGNDYDHVIDAEAAKRGPRRIVAFRRLEKYLISKCR